MWHWDVKPSVVLAARARACGQFRGEHLFNFIHFYLPNHGQEETNRCYLQARVISCTDQGARAIDVSISLTNDAHQPPVASFEIVYMLHWTADHLDSDEKLLDADEKYSELLRLAVTDPTVRVGHSKEAEAVKPESIPEAIKDKTESSAATTEGPLNDRKRGIQDHGGPSRHRRMERRRRQVLRLRHASKINSARIFPLAGV